MRKLFYILLGLMIVVFFTKVSLAAEHPGMSSMEHGKAPGEPIKEHPGEHKEHPGKTHEAEHPGAEHPGEEEVLSAEEVIKGIKSHIDSIAKANNGYFLVNDPVEDKALRLKLLKVHEDKVSYIKKEDAYFACTDFIKDDGKVAYDIDFWMKKGPDGKLEVYQTKIHKKGGKPRFTYRDDEIVPVE